MRAQWTLLATAALVAAALNTCSAQAEKRQPFMPDSSYSYAQFVLDFDREQSLNNFRKEVFEKNLREILEQNKAYQEGRSSWYAAVNEFADWTPDEMETLRGHRRDMSQRLRARFESTSNAFDQAHDAEAAQGLPASVDWRSKNVTTTPKQQSGCGACWAFSTAETIESFVAINTGQLLELSPQQMVDCVQNPDQCGGKGGCQGAVQQLGFDYVSKAGLALEADYPYQAKDGRCSATRAKPAVSISGFENIRPNDANALMEAVATKGPVAISAAAKTWGFYFGGIFDGSLGDHCDVDVDHAVQLVGYGTDTIKGVQKAYWLVRNSWGAKWGESGYIRVLRTPGNEPCATDPRPLDGVCGKKGACKCNSTVKYCGTCGILADSSYPTGAKLLSATPDYKTGYVWNNSTAKVHAPVLSESVGFEDIMAETPDVVDWRKKGNVVSPVKDQGPCGACWAFSTVENVESAYAIASNSPVQKLSVEQVLVCCGNDIKTCSGCMGGDTITAYEYLQNRSNGLDSDDAYPYDPHTDPFDPPKCKANASAPVAKVTGWSYAVRRCEGGDCSESWRSNGDAEAQLAAVVASQGPVSICIDAEASLKKYTGGVLDPTDCKSSVKSLNHCVQLVGFDRSGSEPYWIVRNSWGEKYGEDGYFRLIYGKNACGITDEATVVHVAKAGQ